MSIIELPKNIIAQVRPIPLFDEVVSLGAGLIKQYQNVVTMAFVSIHLQCHFNATLVVVVTSTAGQIITYYNGPLAADTGYHLEIGSASLNVAVQITNTDAVAGNISIIYHYLQAV
jgi:hypothetical protein